MVKFTNVVKLCEAFELAYLGENLSGLDIEKMNSEKQKELYIECKLIFKKNMFHSMLKTNHQTQFLVRNFIEDLVNNLDHELLSLEDYKNSITYQKLKL